VKEICHVAGSCKTCANPKHALHPGRPVTFDIGWLQYSVLLLLRRRVYCCDAAQTRGTAGSHGPFSSRFHR